MVLYGAAWKFISSMIAGTILATSGVVLRFVARWIGGIKTTVDDYLLLVALILYWSQIVGGILLVENGLGQPLADIPPQSLVAFLKMQFASSFTYTMTIFFIKSSILTMYWRVLPSDGVRRNVYICGTFVSAWAVAVCIVGGLACIPARKLWNPQIEGTCMKWAPLYLGIQIPNIVTDIFVVVIPLREVFGLTMIKMQKIILVGIFGIAGLTVIFDIIHLVATLDFAKSKQDFTVSIVAPSIWTALVPAIAIFATCLTNLRPLFRYLSAVHARFLQQAKSMKESFRTNLTESQDNPTVDACHLPHDQTGESLDIKSTANLTERRKSHTSV